MAVVSRHRRAHRGAALVEFAIVLPLVLMLLLGLMEYGWMILKSQEVANAARAGARAGALADGTSATVTAAVDAAMAAAGLADSGFTVTTTPESPVTLDSGEAFTVTVTVAYAGNLELIGLVLIPTPANLQSTVVMAREGP